MSTHEDDHVRIRPIEGHLEIFCQKCSAFERVTLPVSVEEIGTKSTSFIQKHLDCGKML